MFFQFSKSRKDALIMGLLSGGLMISIFLIGVSCVEISDRITGESGSPRDLLYLIPIFVTSCYGIHKISKYAVSLELKHLGKDPS
jgi:amino acid permease